MIKTILIFALPIAIGAVIGGLMGATRSCEDGGCPLTANPWRGGIYGAFIGLLFAFSSRGAQAEQVDHQPHDGDHSEDRQ